METLRTLGWTPAWAARFEPFEQPGYFPGRICVEHRERYHFDAEQGGGEAVVSGRLRHAATGRADFPAVGDWVVLERGGNQLAVIHAVLERENKFARRMAGREADEQIIAANLTTLFLVTSLNRDLNPRRLERYLAAVAAQSIQPVIVLSKSDLDECPEDSAVRIRGSIRGIAVHAVSARTGAGLESLAEYLARGKTVAMVGSSGVGKSTLINRLLGVDSLEVRAIREKDDRGRHTTTHRELVQLPGGALLIDNPGMREFQLWNEDAEVDATFEDVTELVAHCYFPDCSHQHEPHCAVRQALEAGTLDVERLENYRKLQRELAFEAARHDPQAQRERKERWKKIHRAHNKVKRRRE